MDDLMAIEQMDISVGEKLAGQRQNTLVRCCSSVGELGDQGPLYLLGSTVIMIAWWRDKPRLLHTGVRMIAAVAVADLSKRMIKKLVTRSRPHQLLDEDNYERNSGGSHEKSLQSFPSGHAAGTVAVARAISRSYPRAGKAAMAGAALVGLSRLLKGAHWPMDVAVGALLGWVSEQVSRRVMLDLAVDD